MSEAPTDHKADAWSGHTPGPWHYFQADYRRMHDSSLLPIFTVGPEEFHTVAEVRAGCEDDNLPAQTEANAALIAAAPKLAAELTRLRSALTAAETALESAANALEEVGQRTWDKRHHDECKAACADASEMAGGARDEARTALAALQQARKQ